ncbi:MAG: helix-turn-helix domain-containing protein [bacterium]|nr:helix-turn-helix domain-containing protein [bacterium]
MTSTTTTLTVDELDAARILCLSPGTLRNWRSMSRGPRFARVGRRIVYRVADLDDWLTEHTVEPGARRPANT